MAWLQNLAGKAETLLNKIDQNAANVLLNETNNSTKLDNEGEASIIIEPNLFVVNASSTEEEEVNSVKSSFNNDENDDNSLIINLLSNNSRESSSPFENVETNYEDRDKINLLESTNSNLSKQLINLQHLYRELQDDNGNLQNQLERANLLVQEANERIEQYKAHARKTLLQQTSANNSQINSSFSSLNNKENEELIYLRNETKSLEEKNSELLEKIDLLNNNLCSLQQQFVYLQNSNEGDKQTILNNLMQEKNCRTIAEDECKSKTKELHSALFKLSENEVLLKKQAESIEELKKQLKQRKASNLNEEVELRLQSLTEILMEKQSSLETITTERNALRMQLDKLQVEFNKLNSQQQNLLSLNKNSKNRGRGIIEDLMNSDSENNDRFNKLMEVSPFDVGMTRRVKQTYSTLDAISIRSGVFLRRYPLARIFVFCYMILLHIWVLFVLFTYIPTTR